MEINRLELTGTVAEIQPVRTTPAGVRQLRFKLAHRSKQMECGQPMVVDFSIQVVVLDKLATRLQGQLQPSQQVRVSGFIDIAGYYQEQNRLMVIRAEEIEILPH